MNYAAKGRSGSSYEDRVEVSVIHSTFLITSNTCSIPTVSVLKLLALIHLLLKIIRGMYAVVQLIQRRLSS